MSWAMTIARRGDDIGEGGAERAGDALVELVGHDAATS